MVSSRSRSPPLDAEFLRPASAYRRYRRDHQGRFVDRKRWSPASPPPSACGAEVQVVPGASLACLPLYSPEETLRTPEQVRFVDTVRQADGLILATPAYHAGMSGLLKNAIDLLEDLRDEPRPYLDGRAVGCIVTAYGWQGPGRR